MGRKSDADSLQSRVRSAANQIKILDQKGVIDISSIQLWFGTLIGSFAALYIFWNVFIVEEYPRDHFPDHLKVKFENQKDLFAQYGGRQGIAHQIQVSFVACSESQVDDVIASVKNLAILSVTPIHAVFFTQDGVMKRLLKEVELFSQQIPGRLTVDWQFGKENLYTDSESYPCAQQKLLIPIDLQQYKIPAVLVPSVNFLTLSKTDLLWRNGLISMDNRHGISTFLDNDTQPSDDLIAYDLNRISEITLYDRCDAEIVVNGELWHQYSIWERLRLKHPDLPSIAAELKSIYECNNSILKRIDFEFENGKFGIRKRFNQKVFESLQSGFLMTTAKLEGFNEAAWEKLDKLEGTEIDRDLLKKNLEIISDSYSEVTAELDKQAASIENL